MTTSLLTVDGMVHHQADLVIERLIDQAVIDIDGRLLVAMVDVLAMVQLDADAEVVRVQYVDGTTCVMRVAEIVDGNDTFLQLQLDRRLGAGNGTWRVHLWSHESGRSAHVVSIHAMTFASFVGLA